MFMVRIFFWVVNLNFSVSTSGILRWMRAWIFSSFVASFLFTVTSYVRVLPASGGLKSRSTLPAPIERMVAIFPL